MLKAKKGGKCILFSTHVMEEAEYMCDRIGVVQRGQLKITGTMEELRAATGKQRLREIFLDLLVSGELVKDRWAMSSRSAQRSIKKNCSKCFATGAP